MLSHVLQKRGHAKVQCTMKCPHREPVQADEDRVVRYSKAGNRHEYVSKLLR